MQQPGAPSVEEILEAIKQVIARDNRAPADSRASETRARGADDVLDLALLDGLTEAGAAAPAPGEANGSLVTPEARNSMRESLAALSMLSEPRAQPQIVRSGETSLEGMVRELLRPALTEWLDANLPAIVERLVSAEIARIVGKRS